MTNNGDKKQDTDRGGDFNEHISSNESLNEGVKRSDPVLDTIPPPKQPPPDNKDD